MPQAEEQGYIKQAAKAKLSSLSFCANKKEFGFSGSFLLLYETRTLTNPYQKLGFVEIKRYTKENGIDVITMELEL
nr:hypothetical protein [Eubacteriales bacterium]